MSTLAIGKLYVNILKAKILQKIENTTKKNVIVENPIIVIDYISGTKVSTPGEGDGETFEWNCKLEFEAIKEKTSFFLQCYNNNSENEYNLLGETRIPLILAIENEKFKQWYPIYLKEKKRKKSNFVCRGEILLDIEFFSNDKIQNENLVFTNLLSNEKKIKNPYTKPINQPSKTSSFSIVDNDNISEINMQLPLERPNANSEDNKNTSLQNFQKEEEDFKNHQLYQDMEDISIYNYSINYEKEGFKKVLRSNSVNSKHEFERKKSLK